MTTASTKTGYVLVNLAEVAFRRGDSSQARSLIAEAQAHSNDFGEKVVAANSEWLLGRIAARDDDTAAATRHFEAAIELLNPLDMPHRLREAHLEFGRVLRAAGEMAEAADQFERAAMISQSVTGSDVDLDSVQGVAGSRGTEG